VTAMTSVRRRGQARYATTYRAQQRLVRSNWMLLWVVFATAALIYLPYVMTSHSIFGLHLTRHELLNMNMTSIDITLIYIVGALGLNLLTGYTGLISVGNAAFYAIGAMVAASIGIKWLHLPFVVVVLAAGVAGAIVGAVVGLPALRIRGIYLLLGTLALQFVMSYLFLKFQAKYFGIVGVVFAGRTATFFGLKLDNDKHWYFFLLGFAALALLLVKNILRSRHGRAFVAVRDHPIAASAAGINVSYVRVLSFSISSFIVCASGATYVWYLGGATQDNFQLSLAIAFIAMIVIGGEGSLVGTVLGAILWQLFPSALIAFAEMAGGVSPSVSNEVHKWQTQITNIVFGSLILLVLIFAPTGLNGLWLKFKQAFTRWPYTT
jgi:branched-chain amino acid transport system permease protein